LTHVKGEWAGQSLRLRPWQEQVVRQLFGTVRPDGTRQYRTCYIEIPRKNGKTTLAAALALYLLVGDGEPGAEVYSAAVDLEQASLAFNTAAQMIYQDAELSRVLEVVPSRRRIVYPATGGFYRAIPADAPSAHGYNASGVIYDELHAAPNRDLWDVLTTSMGARRQPLTIVITTAGYDRHSICWELHQYAEKVRDGVIDDPTFLPILYGAPQEADWTDEAVWRAANPALGDFRSLDELRTAYRQASEVPARQQTFRRLYLCQWTESAERWLDLARWDAGSVPVNLTGLAGRRAWGGLDLASTTDLTAFVLVVPDEDAGYAVLPYFWLPREGLRRRAARDRVPYEQWAAEGWLEVTEGEVVDYALIRARIRELATRLRIVEIGYDRWNASQLVTELQQDGATMVPISQGFAGLSAPARTLEQLVLGGRLRHGGHPVLRWCVANTVVEQDAYGNVRPSKRRSTDRIDGVVALLMALDRATRHGGAMSVYERRELVTV
jgi:phage terminase large subunit-like protein